MDGATGGRLGSTGSAGPACPGAASSGCRRGSSSRFREPRGAGEAVEAALLEILEKRRGAGDRAVHRVRGDGVRALDRDADRDGDDDRDQQRRQSEELQDSGTRGFSTVYSFFDGSSCEPWLWYQTPARSCSLAL
jgi:hypothetical protein